jgi:signal transduction histidine kinase
MPMPSLSRRTLLEVLHWFAAVRGRAAIVSILIVGGAFALSAVGVCDVLRDSLYASAANSAQAEAIDISSFITARNDIPGHLPSSAEDVAAQIIDSHGNVLSSSRNIIGQPAMVSLSPPPGKAVYSSGIFLHVKRFTHVNLDLDHRFVVAAVGLSNPTSARTVLVAQSLGAADHAVTLVKRLLFTALPILALIVGALVWFLTGWALRPVEGIRAEVDELSAMELHRRVPEPAVQDEIGRLARTMNRLLGRLEKSIDRQRRLVADVSHELRNPLAAMQTQLEVAIAHPGRSSAGLIEGTMSEVSRMSQLVEDLLTLARLDEGIVPIRRGDVDLDDLAFAQAERLRLNGKVEVSVEGVSAARLRGDEAQLTRVVTNLADNAERYARHRVTFAVTRQNGTLDLLVTDDGPGIPIEDRERIFERFARLDTARTYQESGAGLGLAIVRELVAAHGGTVWVEDARPGARFIVRLPATA